MLPIVQFCWHRFTPRSLTSATVGEMYNLCQAAPPDPFVFYDPAHHFSSLVLPREVCRIVDTLHLPFWESASKIGLFDLIGQDQMHVHYQQPATLIAEVAVRCHKHVVLALDDRDRPVGVFVPSVAAERIPQVENKFWANSGIKDLAGSIADLSSTRQEFHSELFNQQAPDPYICEGDAEDGSHVISYCPCNYHPGSVCGRRQVAER